MGVLEVELTLSSPHRISLSPTGREGATVLSPAPDYVSVLAAKASRATKTPLAKNQTGKKVLGLLANRRTKKFMLDGSSLHGPHIHRAYHNELQYPPVVAAIHSKALPQVSTLPRPWHLFPLYCHHNWQGT